MSADWVGGVPTTFDEILARDGVLVYRTRGTSMEPMLRQDRDLVVVRAPSSRPKRHDVVLYRRGDAYVLHRVIEVGDSHYLIRGDNTFALERVPDSSVIGLLTAFQRKGRQHDVTDRGYLLYVRLWCAAYPLRSCCFHVRHLVVRTARRLGVLPHLKALLRR